MRYSEIDELRKRLRQQHAELKELIAQEQEWHGRGETERFVLHIAQTLDTLLTFLPEEYATAESVGEIACGINGSTDDI
jgi:hypothetical protein